jgi:hypothetical protein
MVQVAFCGGLLEMLSAQGAQMVSKPVISKPAPVTMAELAKRKTAGVTVTEVTDYVFGGYKGEFPSPPHADHNAKRAFVVTWEYFPYRFVFAHEGSYCPWFELPSGAGFCYQFFEGNEGWAELFNDFGRKERNSFVDILERGPGRVGVRWTYFGVNMQSGEAAFRGTEDFWAYPNGLVLRRQSYESLIPDKTIGYAREPIEMIGMAPVGKLWSDVLSSTASAGERHALAVLDPFSEKRYDVFWTPAPDAKQIWKGTARRTGCSWKEVDDAAGVALIVPMKDGAPFCIFGDASGFGHDFTRIKEHSFNDTGGWGWISSSWDHWPIGWLNSQAHEVDTESLKVYPNHFSPAGMDFWSLPNEDSANRSFYSLIGIAGGDFEEIRRIARQWLEKGEKGIADSMSGADLRAVPARPAR